jgi:hypothetical protein
LSLRYQDLQRELRSALTAFLLQEKVADLGPVAMRDNYAVFSGKLCYLADWNSQILELLLNRADLSLAD